MIITFLEVIYVLLTILVIGYIFTGLFNLSVRKKDIIDSYTTGFNWDDFWFACLIAAPGIILHEMAHKFVGIGLGLQTFYQISYFGLALGIILKLVGAGFILLAPGYVMIFGSTKLQSIITAAAGPLVNLALWIIALNVLKFKTHLTRKESIFWSLTQHINKWLFIFNILPIPPLDGSKVWIPLLQLIF